MFAYRHDLLKALIADGVKLVVLGRNEKILDLPEFKRMKEINGAAPGGRVVEYTPEKKLLVVAEENLVGSGSAPQAADCEVIRVFAKALYRVTGTRPVDPNWNNRGRAVQQYELRVKRLDIQFDKKLKQIHDAATAKGLWKDTASGRDRVEYWAAGVLAYFDAGRRQPTASGDGLPSMREALKAYDPELYALVHETMAYEGREDWRLRW